MLGSRSDGPTSKFLDGIHRSSLKFARAGFLSMHIGQELVGQVAIRQVSIFLLVVLSTLVKNTVPQFQKIVLWDSSALVLSFESTYCLLKFVQGFERLVISFSSDCNEGEHRGGQDARRNDCDLQKNGENLKEFED